MSFGWPYALLALLALPAAVLVYIAYRRKVARHSVPFPDIDLLVDSSVGDQVDAARGEVQLPLRKEWIIVPAQQRPADVLAKDTPVLVLFNKMLAQP